MTEIESAIGLGISLFAIWYLGFCCWQGFRVELLRHRLFMLRDELFDYAQAGGIEFDNPAYKQLRNLINATIRFAHKASFSRVLATKLFDVPAGPNPMVVWMEQVSRLPLEQQTILRRIHSDVGSLIGWHVVKGSPIALLAMPIAYALAWLRHIPSPAEVLPIRAEVDLLEREALESDDLTPCAV
jgi:hypothetical protein